MKSKKLISLLCAAALTASTFAAFAVTANAATGDSLGTYNFETVEATYPSPSPTATAAAATASPSSSPAAEAEPIQVPTSWKNAWSTTPSTSQIAEYYGSATEANAYFASVIGKQDNGWTTYFPTTVVAPSVTGTKSLYIASQTGMQKAITLTIAPAVTDSSTSVYNVAYDMMLTNGDTDTNNAKTTGREYTVGIGSAGAPMLLLSVVDEKLYYYNGSSKVDTGIELPKTGEWFHFDLKFDSTYHQFKGTITPYNGNNLVDASTVTIPWSAYNKSNAAKITTLTATPIRATSTDKGAVNIALDNFTVTEAAATQYVDVAVKAVTANGTEIKTIRTAKEEAGVTFVASGDDKASFTTEELRAAKKYYKYTGTTDSVTAATGASVNLVFTETDMPKTAVNAVCGSKVIGEIISDNVLPGEKIEGYAHEYMKGTDDKWYQKVEVAGARSLPSYDVSATGGEDAVVVNVNYIPAYDVVSFKEAENDEGTTHGTDSGTYPKSLFSGGEWVQSASNGTYPKGFVTDAVEAAGTYSVTVHHYSNANRPFAVGTLSRADRDTKYAEKFGESTANGMYTETFTAALEEGNCFYIGKNGDGMGTTVASDTKAIADIDYIVVKDTSLDAAPVPAVTIGDVDTTAATAALTLTNKEEFAALGITPKVTLIQAVYDGTALSDVKIWNNVEIDPATGTATATITGAATGASVFYVWDAVGGVRPLGEAKPITVSTPE